MPRGFVQNGGAVQANLQPRRSGATGQDKCHIAILREALEVDLICPANRVKVYSLCEFSLCALCEL